MSIEDFKMLYQDGYSMKNTEDAYDVLNELVKDALNKANENQELLIETLKEKWIPFIGELHDKHFFIALENFGNIMEPLSDKYDNVLRENIAYAVNDLDTTSEWRRKYLIMSITDYSAMYNNRIRTQKAF